MQVRYFYIIQRISNKQIKLMLYDFPNKYQVCHSHGKQGIGILIFPDSENRVVVIFFDDHCSVFFCCCCFPFCLFLHFFYIRIKNGKNKIHSAALEILTALAQQCRLAGVLRCQLVLEICRCLSSSSLYQVHV